MLTWRVPIDIPDAMRTSNKPITRRERERNLYALTGFVRVVKLQADCDFHVQVAQSRAANVPQMIVEVPHRFHAGQRELMALLRGLHVVADKVARHNSIATRPTTSIFSA